MIEKPFKVLDFNVKSIQNMWTNNWIFCQKMFFLMAMNAKFSFSSSMLEFKVVKPSIQDQRRVSQAIWGCAIPDDQGLHLQHSRGRVDTLVPPDGGWMQCRISFVEPNVLIALKTKFATSKNWQFELLFFFVSHFKSSKLFQTLYSGELF